MSTTGSGASGAERPAGTSAGGFPASPAQGYFRAIEELFLELRGAPLTLSPADWRTSREWQEAGLPLALVLRTIRELFERRKERGAADRVWTLGQCQRSVRAAWRRHLELNAAAAPPEPTGVDVAPLGERLARLAETIPDDVPGAGSLRARVRALGERRAGEEPREEAVEETLAALDREMVAAALAALDASEREALEADVERSRRALAARIPEAELRRAGPELRDRTLRRRRGLPLLSLFALDDAAETDD